MVEPAAFVHLLKQHGFKNFTGVPCSFFQSAINCVIADSDLKYTIVPNEGSALALAAGHELAGGSCAVMIQNSGFGNLINPLTSLNMIYDIPILIFISGRAYGVPDEPQHEVIGRTMANILHTLGITFEDLPSEKNGIDAAFTRAQKCMKTKRQPFVFFVRKDTIGSFESLPAQSSYPMKRIEAIKVIAAALNGDDCVIATTGMTSRELFAVSDRPHFFYMQGSMGHAPAIAMGVAQARPHQPVWILDGDGALLMHLGILSTIGHYGLNNLFHIVLDNEAYETTGNQDTTSVTTDFLAMARAAGYQAVFSAINESELRECLRNIRLNNGPAMLRVKINRDSAEKVPRITTRYTAPQISENFRTAIQSVLP